MITRFCATAIVAMAAGCAQPTPEQQIVNDAAAALGGRERLAAVRTLAFESGEGGQFNLGQDVRPEARGQVFTVSALTRRLDVANGRSRTELTRTPVFVYFQGQAPQRQIQGLDGAVAYNVAANGTATRATEQTTRDRRADFYHHPVTLVRAALAEGARLSNAQAAGAERVVQIATADGLELALAVDTSGLPVRIESMSAHPNLGDVRLSTAFADYQDVSGIRLPATVSTRIDDFVTAEVRYGRQIVDGDVGDLAAPSAVASAAPVSNPPPTVAVEVVAPGVWRLAGQSHHSALIEMSDHLVLVDAPQSEARTRAVIAKAGELRPDKPLRKVIATHHHFDHTAGIRAAVAEGLAIVTHGGNRAFFEHVTTRRHSITPDALAKTPRTATIETVDEELMLEDPLRTVAVYHVSGNPHSETMLMVHLPAERVIVQVDAFSPGSAANPYAANLLDNITRRKLAVDRIVPLHGAMAPFTDLVKLQEARTP